MYIYLCTIIVETTVHGFPKFVMAYVLDIHVYLNYCRVCSREPDSPSGRCQIIACWIYNTITNTIM